MNKVNAFSAILKFINGKNDSRKYLEEMYEYITDPAKTDNGKLVATHGCSCNHPLRDIIMNKKLYNKTDGKQGEHFVLSFPPDGSNKSPVEILNIVRSIVAAVYPDYMSICVVHTDTKVIHAHVMLDSVNAVTGRKFSQSPSDLNRVKQRTNNILRKHGFEIITASANEFIDHTDYSNAVGFDFLEPDDSELITESDVKAIEAYTDNISVDSITNRFGGWDYPGYYNANDFGGYNTMNIYENNAINVQQVQEVPALVPTVENVPATVGMPCNIYTNTTVVTGPIFRIKGNENSDFAGLDTLVSQTTVYAQEHQRESVNLALAMQMKSQQNGILTNVAVVAGPIFDIDFTGSMGTPATYYSENDT